MSTMTATATANQATLPIRMVPEGTTLPRPKPPAAGKPKSLGAYATWRDDRGRPAVVPYSYRATPHNIDGSYHHHRAILTHWVVVSTPQGVAVFLQSNTAIAEAIGIRRGRITPSRPDGISTGTYLYEILRREPADATGRSAMKIPAASRTNDRITAPPHLVAERRFVRVDRLLALAREQLSDPATAPRFRAIASYLDSGRALALKSDARWPTQPDGRLSPPPSPGPPPEPAPSPAAPEPEPEEPATFTAKVGLARRVRDLETRLAAAEAEAVRLRGAARDDAATARREAILWEVVEAFRAAETWEDVEVVRQLLGDEIAAGRITPPTT